MKKKHGTDQDMPMGELKQIKDFLPLPKKLTFMERSARNARVKRFLKKLPKKWQVKQITPMGDSEVVYLKNSVSMDEYFEFVNFCAEYFPINKASGEGKAAMRVNVPFSMK